MITNDRDDRLYIEIGLKISQIRTTVKPKISQEELARRCALTRTSIVHIEKGRQRLPIDRLYRIAEALNVEITQLLPIKRNKSNIDPASMNNISEDSKNKVEQILKKHKGEI